MPSIAQNLLRSGELLPISDSARLDTELLLAAAIDRDRTYLFTWPEKTLTVDQQSAFQHAFARRLRGEPIAYILGEREFWSMPLWVSEETLIPRPDSECLVEHALTRVSSKTRKILDLGTGTGAIALALARECPGVQVLGIDVKAAAVDLARRNAERHNLSNVSFQVGDWFCGLNERDFDLIVSNPPYLSSFDPHLQQGDVRFEPHSALVAKNSGLADLFAIVDSAPQYLQQGGYLLLEHGCEQAAPLRAHMRARYSDVQTQQDLAGLDRVSIGSKNRT